MGKRKITQKERNKDPLKYYKSIAVSIGKIVKTSNNDDFRKKCESVLNITNAAEVEERLIQLMQEQKVISAPVQLN